MSGMKPTGAAVQIEICFLTHRLEVVELWPDSARKAATKQAISERLRALGYEPGPLNGVSDVESRARVQT